MNNHIDYGCENEFTPPEDEEIKIEGEEIWHVGKEENHNGI